MKQENQKLECALSYAGLGIAIIPCHSVKDGKCSCGIPDCAYPGKHPRTTHGPLDATTDPKIIRGWWERMPDSNIGGVTGAISGIVVLDLDTKHGKSSREMLQSMAEKDFGVPATVSSQTGAYGDEKERGTHFFFKHPGVKIKNGTNILKDFGILGVDCRGDGGMVIMAPSDHFSGVLYEWQIGLEGVGKIENLADMPNWLIEIATPKKSEPKWLNAKDGVSEGSRNDSAASMAGKILSSMDPELWEILGWDQFEIWNSKNTPPLSERELRGVWNSIKRLNAQSNKIQWKNVSEEKSKKGKAIVKCFADIQSVPISWLWHGRIALGKLTMLAGDPGLGKSLVTATLAAHVSKGYAWPVDQSVPPTGDIILISAEDDPADTIKPRLEAAGADCTRIHVVEAIQEEIVDAESESTQHMFSFKRDIATLGDLLSSLPNCRLVIIDPISAYLDSADSNNNSDIRGLLAPLSELASKHKVAIVLVSHLNKNSGGNASYRVMGSLAFTAAVRTAYIVTKDKENPERRLLMPLKNNIAKDKTGLAYSIVEAENGQPVIAWESEPVEITTEEALAFSQSAEQHTATDEAVNFLIDLLAEGPAKADEAIKEAQRIGITSKPLRDARGKLGIKSKKSSSFKDGFWEWKLPEGALNTEDAQPKEVGALEQARHLGDTPKTRLDSFIDSLGLEVEKDKKVVDNTPPKLPEQPPEQKDLPF